MRNAHHVKQNEPALFQSLSLTLPLIQKLSNSAIESNLRPFLHFYSWIELYGQKDNDECMRVLIDFNNINNNNKYNNICKHFRCLNHVFFINLVPLYKEVHLAILFRG